MAAGMVLAITALVNVLWGAVNFVIGYVLIFAVGDFNLGLTLDVLMVGLGALFVAVILALYLGFIRK